MSDQVSEKLARMCYFSHPEGNEWSKEKEDRFIENLKLAGLIKTSKLDEAREWCDKEGMMGTPKDDWEAGFKSGVRRTREYWEAAITEILGDKDD